jgi:hypothetical protein
MQSTAEQLVIAASILDGYTQENLVAKRQVRAVRSFLNVENSFLQNAASRCRAASLFTDAWSKHCSTCFAFVCSVTARYFKAEKHDNNFVQLYFFESDGSDADVFPVSVRNEAEVLSTLRFLVAEQLALFPGEGFFVFLSLHAVQALQQSHVQGSNYAVLLDQIDSNSRSFCAPALSQRLHVEQSGALSSLSPLTHEHRPSERVLRMATQQPSQRRFDGA